MSSNFLNSQNYSITVDKKAEIYFCHRMNYKWYTKLNLRINGGCERFRFLLKKGRCIVIESRGLCSILDMDYVVNGSASNVYPKKDFAGVAVVDTEEIQISHFDKTVIPPPLSNFAFHIDSKINGWILKVFYSEKHFFILTYSKLLIYSPEDYKLITSLDLPGDVMEKINECNVTQFLIKEIDTTIFAFICIPSSDSNSDCLYIIRISNDWKLEKSTALPCKKVLSMCLNGVSQPSESSLNSAYFSHLNLIEEVQLDKNYLIIHFIDKSVEAVYFTLPEISTKKILDLPLGLHQITSAFVGHQEGIIGLSANMKLYINTVLFSTDVTSYLVCDNKLMFTKTSPGLSHLFYIFDLHAVLPIPGNQMTVSLPTLESKSNNVRAIERSARIISYKKPKLVLQLPRGNLETIHPRLPVLQVIREYLQNNKYSEAFLECRKHKINTNLVHDLNPEAFRGNVEMFLSQLTKIDYVNLFINSL